MKHPRLRVKKKVRITSIRRLKQEISEAVEDCLVDIRPYIVKDILHMLKKRGIVYHAKNKKKN